VLGLVTVAALTLLLAVAALGTARVVVPALIIPLGALMLVGALVKPGTAILPTMAGTGRAGLALVVLAMALAVWHVAAPIAASSPSKLAQV
jgi:hypothetical protein